MIVRLTARRKSSPHAALQAARSGTELKAAFGIRIS
jgi:hypothetical protein